MFANETIRQDPSGALNGFLRLHIETGRRLRTLAGQIYEPADFDAWRERLTAWRCASAGTLDAGFAHETTAEFLRASALPAHQHLPWAKALPVELRRLGDALELLVSLQSTLGSRRSPARPPLAQR